MKESLLYEKDTIKRSNVPTLCKKKIKKIKKNLIHQNGNFSIFLKRKKIIELIDCIINIHLYSFTNDVDDRNMELM